MYFLEEVIRKVNALSLSNQLSECIMQRVDIEGNGLLGFFLWVGENGVRWATPCSGVTGGGDWGHSSAPAVFHREILQIG